MPTTPSTDTGKLTKAQLAEILEIDERLVDFVTVKDWDGICTTKSLDYSLQLRGRELLRDLASRDGATSTAGMSVQSADSSQSLGTFSITYGVDNATADDDLARVAKSLQAISYLQIPDSQPYQGASDKRPIMYFLGLVEAEVADHDVGDRLAYKFLRRCFAETPRATMVQAVRQGLPANQYKRNYRKMLTLAAQWALTTYRASNSLARLDDLLHSCRQGPSQTVTQFVDDLTKLRAQCHACNYHLSDQQMRRVFTLGLKPRLKAVLDGTCLDPNLTMEDLAERLSSHELQPQQVPGDKRSPAKLTSTSSLPADPLQPTTLAARGGHAAGRTVHTSFAKSDPVKFQQCLKKGLCLFFAFKGSCNRGDQCSYKHVTLDSTTSKPQAPPPPDDVKKSYLVQAPSVSTSVHSCTSLDTSGHLSSIQTPFGVPLVLDGGSQASLLHSSIAALLPSHTYPQHPLHTCQSLQGITDGLFEAHSYINITLLGVQVPFLLVDSLPSGIFGLVGANLINHVVLDYVSGVARHTNGHTCPIQPLCSVPTSGSPQDDAPTLTLPKSGDMTVIRDYGWLQVGIRQNPDNPDKQQFIAEISDQVLADAQALPQRKTPTHNYYKQASPAVQQDCDRLVSDFVRNGKLVKIPSAEAHCYPQSTTTNYYPITKPRVRPIFPCIGINKLLKRYGRLQFHQVKLEQLYNLARSSDRLILLDLYDAFMHLVTGVNLQKLLTVIDPLGDRYFATRCIYGLSLSPCLLEVACHYLIARHTSQIIPPALLSTSTQSADTSLPSPLPDEPTLLLDCTFEFFVQENVDVHIVSYMDDITFFLSSYAAKSISPQTFIANISNVAEDYTLQFKPAKIKIVHDEAEVSTLGFTLYDHGQYISVAGKHWLAVLDWEWPPVITYRQVLSFLGKIPTLYPSLMPDHTVVIKHAFQALLSKARDLSCQEHNVKPTLKRSWDLQVPPDILDLLQRYQDLLKSCVRPRVPRVLPRDVTLDVYCDASSYMLGFVLVDPAHPHIPLMKQQFLLRGPRARHVHISVKELQSILYSMSAIRTHQLYSGRRFNLCIRSDNVTACKIITTRRVSSGTQQHHYLSILRHLELLGVPDQYQVRYISSAENLADPLTRHELVEDIIRRLWNLSDSDAVDPHGPTLVRAPQDHSLAGSLADLPSNDSDDVLFGLMAKREEHPDDNLSTIGNRVKRRRQHERQGTGCHDLQQASTSSPVATLSPAVAGPSSAPGPASVTPIPFTHDPSPQDSTSAYQPAQLHDDPPSIDNSSSSSTTPQQSAPSRVLPAVPAVKPLLYDFSPNKLKQRIVDKLSTLGICFDNLVLDQVISTDDAVLQQQLVLYYHSIAHDAYEGTLSRLAHFTWPSKKADVKRFTSACELCQQERVSAGDRQLKEPPREPTLPLSVFTNISLDTVGPFYTSPDRKQSCFCVILIDRLSCYTLAAGCYAPPTYQDALNLLYRVIDTYGVIPSTVLTDNGSMYVRAANSLVGARLDLDLSSINWMFTGIHSSPSNGQIERHMREFGSLLRITLRSFKLDISTISADTWWHITQHCTYLLNTRTRGSSKICPYNLIHLHSCPDLLTGQSHPQDGTALMDRWKTIRLQQLLRSWRNLKVARSTTTPITTGSEVFIRNDYSDKRKQSLKFLGPYVVTEVLGNNRYRLNNNTVQNSRNLKQRVFTDVLPDDGDSDTD